MARKKITIVGAGKVGSQAAMITAYKQLGDIVIWNRTEGVAKGIALDILESSPVDDFDIDIIGTADYKDTARSDIIVITAGSQRQAGQSRDDLLLTNAVIVKDIVQNTAKYSMDAVLVVVTNPLDVMVWLAHHVSYFPRNRVMGMAGILDTSRFKSFIARELNVSVEDVTAMVLGGHGDFMLPLPNYASVNGIPVNELLPDKKIEELIERTRKGGEEIINLEKSSAFFAPAYALVEMIEAIVKDKKRILPCAALLQGEYGIRNLFMGVPVKLGSNGVEEIIELHLTDKEQREFFASAAEIKKMTDKLVEKNLVHV
jgi:malate dehydrogenase